MTMKVELVDHMGSDLSVVNAARVSMDKESEWELIGEREVQIYPDLPSVVQDKLAPMMIDVYGLKEGDKKLISYLAKHKHWTPFAHTTVSLRLKAPIFVARQLGKHQVGLVWNEVSRRYVDSEPEFYEPERWRMRAENVKQGSSDEALETLPNAQQVSYEEGCQTCGKALNTSRECEKARKKYCDSNCQALGYRKTPEGWARIKIARLKSSAAKRGLDFDLGYKDLLPLPSICSVIGVPLNYEAGKLVAESPSVNRIDNQKGYVRGNTEIISNKANMMLSNASKDELKAFVKNVALREGVFFQGTSDVSEFYQECKNLYRRLIESGMCAEQARMFMPQAALTEWIWTGNLVALANMCKLRLDSHTQRETQEVAKMVNDVIAPLFPVSWKELMDV